MITSLLSGGIVGIIGSILTNIFDFFKEKQKNKQAIELKKLDLQMMDKEYQASINQSRIKADMSMEISADSLQIESYEHDGRIFSSGFKPSKFGKALLVLVDVFRAFVRPFLTMYMIYLLQKVQADVYILISQTKYEALNIAEALNIYHEIISLILFLATAAFLWWFGTRKMKSKNEL